MGGGKAEGGKVDARSKAKAEVVGPGKVVGGVVVGGNGRADLESIVPRHRMRCHMTMGRWMSWRSIMAYLKTRKMLEDFCVALNA